MRQFCRYRIIDRRQTAQIELSNNAVSDAARKIIPERQM